MPACCVEKSCNTQSIACVFSPCRAAKPLAHPASPDYKYRFKINRAADLLLEKDSPTFSKVTGTPRSFTPAWGLPHRVGRAMYTNQHAKSHPQWFCSKTPVAAAVKRAGKQPSEKTGFQKFLARSRADSSHSGALAAAPFSHSPVATRISQSSQVRSSIIRS